VVATDSSKAATGWIAKCVCAVNHFHEKLVSAEIHTGGIESFWALIKRRVVGTCHNVSAK
jgi:hypothetical protein